mmetsp:Transcript_11970/g.14864  ORF Transcript_11970/g.14864 Transcript_11970/m.14864 type:complete len:88 (-) Transcript_11970:1302-1565(-)
MRSQTVKVYARLNPNAVRPITGKKTKVCVESKTPITPHVKDKLIDTKRAKRTTLLADVVMNINRHVDIAIEIRPDPQARMIAFLYMN